MAAGTAGVHADLLAVLAAHGGEAAVERLSPRGPVPTSAPAPVPVEALP